MEEEGLVERHPDPAHRRATLLHVTPAGQHRFAEAWTILEPSQQARLGALLDDDELDILEKITRKVRDANRAGPGKELEAREPPARSRRRASRGRGMLPVGVEGDLLTIDEAAEFLSISPLSMRRLIKSGEVQSVRVGVRTTRIRLSDLDDYARTLP
jgi:excisionase family DNA binding protein